jgi:hypothetical protein
VVVVVLRVLSLELGNLHRDVYVVVEGEGCWRRSVHLARLSLFQYARALFRRPRSQIRRIGPGWWVASLKCTLHRLDGRCCGER